MTTQPVPGEQAAPSPDEDEGAVGRLTGHQYGPDELVLYNAAGQVIRKSVISPGQSLILEMPYGDPPMQVMRLEFHRGERLARDVEGQPPVSEQPPTYYQARPGLKVQWCSEHGYCTCPYMVGRRDRYQEADMWDPDCALHGEASARLPRRERCPICWKHLED